MNVHLTKRPYNIGRSCNTSMNSFLIKVFGTFLFLGLSIQQASAHGSHIWFVTPEENTVFEAGVQNAITFELEAPYSKHRYINLKITKDGEPEAVWEGLVELGNKVYSVQIDLSEWNKGSYKAEVLLVGDIVQYPLSLDFVIE